MAMLGADGLMGSRVMAMLGADGLMDPAALRVKVERGDMTVSEGSTMMNDAWKAMVASVAVGVVWAVVVVGEWVAEVDAVTLTVTVAASARVCDPLTRGRAMDLTTGEATRR